MVADQATPNALLTEISRCEVCGGVDLEPVVDLGDHPLCDDLVKIGEARSVQKFPIKILYCPICRTGHQQFQVDKTYLFPRHYHYRSSLTKDVLNGLQDLVDRCQELLGDLEGKKVLDVGCNDGSLLSFMREKGALTFGIDPTDAAREAAAKGHVVIQDYMSPRVAQALLDEHGAPDIITFTNVFAHIENLAEVLDSLRLLMAEGNKTLIVENHYLGAILDRDQFDTFYHEHPRTYSVTSFRYIADSLKSRILCAEFPRRYGGNLRVVITTDPDAVEACDLGRLMANEKDFGARFSKMMDKVDTIKEQRLTQVHELVSEHGKLRAKAFPGRAAIILEYFGIDESKISAVYEQDSSPKIGFYVPGTRIPIVADRDFDLGDSRPILNLAWHINDEIGDYMRSRGFQGEIYSIF